jgi:hypothetical protein
VAIPTYGPAAVDWEQRVDLRRLRTDRLVSLDHPKTLEEGMVFALETYWGRGELTT